MSKRSCSSALENTGFAFCFGTTTFLAYRRKIEESKQVVPRGFDPRCRWAGGVGVTGASTSTSDFQALQSAQLHRSCPDSPTSISRNTSQNPPVPQLPVSCPPVNTDPTEPTHRGVDKWHFYFGEERHCPTPDYVSFSSSFTLQLASLNQNLGNGEGLVLDYWFC